ncbi:aldo/keto reductase [Corynebacterium kutscheri]|uniref:Aldo/keto reductase, diketogulonate reductase n=1 Tax=Corynebacterium kutscheri TaxID=35755 RepID=A0A0F6TE31_9CORY|nr:aldo/keto reductase [Corynebacterium kutscheri]AKE42081.1 aldo/keto reductase, diketogulonate reductase [Corynebacterium kutscheri]VEH10423.1 putative oxidoreductase [Corynebacterium kutscheri]
MLDSFALADGYTIPAQGFGVFQIPAENTADAAYQAIKAGYRHIDTAQSYFNEKAVGEGIRQSELDREQLFVTTKIWIDSYGEEAAYASILISLEKLGLDYIDLVLLHQPFNDTYGSWRALERAQSEGLIRSLGVSNFTPARLHDLGSFNKVYPVVNQIEINPFHQRTEQVAELQRLGVVVQAWAPFGEGRSGLFDNPVLTEIGQHYGKSVAQVVLRWLYQRGIVSLAKSVRQERMQENLAIDDFSLTEADMEKIAGLDEGTSLFFDHESTATVDFMQDLIQQRRHTN